MPKEPDDLLRFYWPEPFKNDKTSQKHQCSLLSPGEKDCMAWTDASEGKGETVEVHAPKPEGDFIYFGNKNRVLGSLLFQLPFIYISLVHFLPSLSSGKKLNGFTCLSEHLFLLQHLGLPSPLLLLHFIFNPPFC